MGDSSQPQNLYSPMCVFGVFGSFIMATSHLRIFMIFDIFLFEDLTHQDFLDPDFSDTCMWVQDPSKWGYPWFFGGFGSIFMGPSWIWIFMKINKFIFEVLKGQDFSTDICGSRILQSWRIHNSTHFHVGPGPTYMCQKNLDPKNPRSLNPQIEIYQIS